MHVPKAISFQQEQDWAKVRSARHHLAVEMWRRIHDLTGQTPLHSHPEIWFAQMTVSTLPANTDVAALQRRLYDECRIAPLPDWHGNKLMRPSIQGYNSRCDTDRLLFALKKLLP